MCSRARKFSRHGLGDVLGGDVVLEVEPGAALGARHLPEGGDRRRRVLGLGQVHGGDGEAEVGASVGGGLRALGQGGGGGEGAVGGTSRRQAGDGAGRRDEGGDALVPDRAAAHVAG